jgi:hypothetical protein
MRQEFEALPDGRDALGWASGCVAAALGWRAREETSYALTLIATNLAGWLLGAAIFHLLVTWLYLDWLGPMSIANTTLQVGAAFGLALAWPRRAVFAGLFVPLTWQFGAMPGFFLLIFGRAFADPSTGPVDQSAMQAVLFAFRFLFSETWPCLLGAALGWGLSRVRLRLGTRPA